MFAYESIVLGYVKKENFDSIKDLLYLEQAVLNRINQSGNSKIRIKLSGITRKITLNNNAVAKSIKINGDDFEIVFEKIPRFRERRGKFVIYTKDSCKELYFVNPNGKIVKF